MGDVISALRQETGQECFDTFRRCLDRERAGVVEYDDLERGFMSEQGETIRYGGARNVSIRAISSHLVRERNVKQLVERQLGLTA